MMAKKSKQVEEMPYDPEYACFFCQESLKDMTYIKILLTFQPRQRHPTLIKSHGDCLNNPIYSALKAHALIISTMVTFPIDTIKRMSEIQDRIDRGVLKLEYMKEEEREEYLHFIRFFNKTRD